MAPRSRLWAKARSTISARSLKACRATWDKSRARILVKYPSISFQKTYGTSTQDGNTIAYRSEAWPFIPVWRLGMGHSVHPTALSH